MAGTGREGFRTLLSRAEDDLWTDFERARELQQSGDIGSAREGALGSFLARQLPGRFVVADGEIIDATGNQTGQTDLVIYDGSNARPLQVFPGGKVLLAAEALLATIEVKSNLTEPEVDKSIKGIKKIHRLRPWGEQWVPPRQGEDAEDRLARVFTSVFAYRSSLTADPWDERELGRLRSRARHCQCPVEFVDRLVVLNRGMVLPAAGRVAQPGEERGVLGLWFFSLINFLAREVERRKPFPWERYEARPPKIWKRVAEPQHDAPRPERPPGTQQARKAAVSRFGKPRRRSGGAARNAKKSPDAARRRGRKKKGS